jgi:signal transduction histidine kinase
MTQIRTSLFWKLMLAFVLVVLVAVGGVALIARQTTTSEFRRLRQSEGQTSDQDQIGRLATYYTEHGSWDGVSSLVIETRGQGHGGRGAGPPLRLADADGRVILDTAGAQVGQRLSAAELAQGEPIVVDGQQVGTLLPGGYGVSSLSQAEQDFLERVQKALVVGALLAIVVALALGFSLFRNITTPLRHLTQATAKVAGGDLALQIPVKSEDEIGQLGLAFNRMTADLARADQLRRDMTADIAHELRTPLTIIQGNLEAILDGVYPADMEHLEPALRKTQLLRHLVEDLRTLALADAGELALHTVPLNLGGLVQRTVKDFGVRAQAAGVKLNSEIPTQSPPVNADAARIEQVLGILLDNALRHTPAGGQIMVHLQLVESEIWASVRDTGEGIPPEALPHVFKRFYRVKSEPNALAGTGLGLSIARAIITAHGGRIWAESTVGQGTKMTLALKRPGPKSAPPSPSRNV